MFLWRSHFLVALRQCGDVQNAPNVTGETGSSHGPHAGNAVKRESGTVSIPARQRYEKTLEDIQHASTNEQSGNGSS